MSDELGGEGLDPIQRRIRRDVTAQGWSWIWVFDSAAECPPFAYSIGFVSSFDHPEVVVAGLPEETSESVLCSVQAMLAEGIAYGDGDRSGDILEGFDVQFRAAPRDLLISHLVQASAFYGEKQFAALQLVWPDRDGNFPGGERAPAWLSDRQALSL
ncbi:DUF4262 domain-containing protein [Actinomadura verrucosospora]|uniref:DUF4262 domain-containing protein n=1 Tax=Actinomadura verrucosospora TaxID=46165 RepID=A0A7D4AR61_ACTVE|nr:DUF4262 domain-containing protein [Actinomadura verrucosospora]QKG24628.1 hypothetical protein ACTIVE_6277 [Actinomadura verrucosospora]